MIQCHLFMVPKVVVLICGSSEPQIFPEPIEVASTSMSEKTVIYGGEFNLMKALKNITEKQSPSMIAVTSSCLTETIGEDMEGIIEKFKDANLDQQFPCL